ncbi:MAG TPA: gluconeogenesis factor YvcK family protein [Candidatus Sulfotelmatobacter sp.]|nr:gluconeogenesis factor YvcK family protein [Candidatus Sulfotelmatobacter sp.]
MKLARVVTIGGGTGSYASLLGLKKHRLKLTAIVNMIDDGGSSGRLRDELGVLPPGDIRQCLVALSESSKLLRELFSYRFEEGELKGHSFGNIFLSTLEKQTGSMKKAISEVGKILNIKGQVIPVTFTKSVLCADLTDKTTIVGQHHVDVVEKKEKRAPIKKIYLKPKSKINIDAKKAIMDADYIIIGPGDLYTSIIPNLLVTGLSNAIKKTKAKKIYVLNLMTKYGQTTNYKAKDHIKVLEEYLGNGVLDYILVNKTVPKKRVLSWYEEYGEHPVEDNLTDSKKVRVIRKDLIKDVIIKKQKSDELRRSIIRHDSKKLAQVIVNLIS